MFYASFLRSIFLSKKNRAAHEYATLPQTSAFKKTQNSRKHGYRFSSHFMLASREDQIALRISATTERMFSELPESVQVKTVLRHPALSSVQRPTQGLFHAEYSFFGAPLSFFDSIS
jgi:hypothetical protein